MCNPPASDEGIRAARAGTKHTPKRDLPPLAKILKTQIPSTCACKATVESAVENLCLRRREGMQHPRSLQRRRFRTCQDTYGTYKDTYGTCEDTYGT